MRAADARHLLRRTEFAARPARVRELMELTKEEAIDDVLRSLDPMPATPAGLGTHRTGNGYWEQYTITTAWWIDRMARDTERPLVEKMTFFWHGVFTTHWSNVFDTPSMIAQHRMLRANALGDLHDIAQKVAVSPAMLRYLNNATNRALAPNQNFARELLEVFLLGVGNYTEADVEAATRAWTGHLMDHDTRRYYFDPAHHDNGLKTFLGRTANFDGPDTIRRILDGSETARRACARHLSRRLWEFFAYERPGDQLVDELATAALRADFRVKPWLRALFRRPEFWSTRARTGLLRSPVDYVVAVQAHLRLRSSVTHPYWFLDRMGQTPMKPPNVAGWKSNAPYLGPSAQAARADYARYVTWRATEDGGYGELRTLAPGAAVDRAAEIFNVRLGSATRSALVDWTAAQGTAWHRRQNLLTIMMLVPEMQVA